MVGLLDLHRSMLRLRRAEELLACIYKENPQPIRTPMHLYAGSEAVAVGVCAALEQTDVCYSHHRCHGHFLAKGGKFFSLVSELMGKETGCSRGRGGSVHLTDRSVGFLASSAILGQTIACAVGSALAFKMRKEPHIAVAFTGDASPEEGVFYESLNFAAIHKLPFLLICENNGLSTESPLSKRYPPNTEFCDRVYSFGVAVKKIDGMNVQEVYETTQHAIELVRNGQPTFIEMSCARFFEHVGPFTDAEMKRAFRSEQDVADLWMKCPISRNAAAILAAGLATQDDLTIMDMEISVGLEADAHCARISEDASGLLENVW